MDKVVRLIESLPYKNFGCVIRIVRYCPGIDRLMAQSQAWMVLATAGTIDAMLALGLGQGSGLTTELPVYGFRRAAEFVRGGNDRQLTGRGPMTSEHTPETRISALMNYTDRLASMRMHLSVVTVLVAINLVLTAVLLWRLWSR